MRTTTILLVLFAVLAACQTNETGTKPSVSADNTQSTKPSASEEEMDITIAPVETSWRADEERWTVLVDVTFRNTGDDVFQLDKVTACSGGRIQNHVFLIKHEGAEVEYQGMMKKRAPPGPDGFHHLKPGESVTERVDLGSVYDLPLNGGTISVRFDHYNHFSPDDVQLLSESVDIELAR